MSKLVRDKIQDLYPKNTYHVASSDQEYWEKLKEKLREEVEEFLKDENEEELADVLEVVDAIMVYKGFSKEKVNATQQKKASERGRFEKRIILDT